MSLTFETTDVAQVDVRDVLDVWQVICQSELAAGTEIDRASIGADSANHADDTACEDAWGKNIKESSRNGNRMNKIPRTR